MALSLLLLLLCICGGANEVAAWVQQRGSSSVYIDCSFSFTDGRHAAGIRGPQAQPLPQWWSAGDVIEAPAGVKQAKNSSNSGDPAPIRLLKLECVNGTVKWSGVYNKSLLFVFFPPPPPHICENNETRREEMLRQQSKETFELCIDVPRGDKRLFSYRANDKCIKQQSGEEEKRGPEADYVWFREGESTLRRHRCCFATPLGRDELPTYIQAIPSPNKIDNVFKAIGGWMMDKRKCHVDPIGGGLTYGLEPHLLDLYGNFNEKGVLSTDLYYSMTKIVGSDSKQHKMPKAIAEPPKQRNLFDPHMFFSSNELFDRLGTEVISAFDFKRFDIFVEQHFGIFDD